MIQYVQNSETDPILKGKHLTSAQQQRQFNFSRVPKDESLQCCIFCGHKSINEPIENGVVVKRNEEKWKTYHECLQIWDTYTYEKAEAERLERPSPPFPKNPVTDECMKQSPKKPTDDFQILMCMCSNAQCAQENTNVGSSCHIGCRKNENERYPFEGHPIKKCTCPVCCCNCNKAYEVSDIQRISIKLAQAANCSESHVSPEVATSRFLGSIITNSLISRKTMIGPIIWQICRICTTNNVAR